MLWANVAQAMANNQTMATSTSTTRGDKQGVLDLNLEQWQSLLEFINSHKVNSMEKNNW